MTDDSEGSDTVPCPLCDGNALFDDCPECRGVGVVYPDDEDDS